MNPGAWWAIGLGGAVLVVTMTMGVFMAAAANNDDDPVAQIPLPSPTTDASPPETEEEAPASTVSEPELPPPTIPTSTVPDFDLAERTLVVGQDIEPGLYTANGQLCYWERVSGLAGTFDEVITNGNAGEHAVVEVLGSDVGLRSRGCSPWTPYAPPPGGPVTSFGDGDWVVGEQVAPGRYQSAGGELCSWERGSGFTHDFIDEVIDFDFGAAPAVVTLDEGERFTSWSCGTWTPG